MLIHKSLSDLNNHASTRHNALTVSSSGQITVDSVETPQPKEGEILALLLRAGVCGTDLQIASRLRPDPATILGHEGVAEIVAVGSQVTGISIGQQIIFNPVNPYNQNDIWGHSTSGIFQQYFLFASPAIEQGRIIPIDSTLPLVCGPLVEPLGTVVYGQLLANKLCPPKRIAIVGAGPIGLLHALYAKSQGCANVFLIHPSQGRLEWAVQQGTVKPEEALLDSPHIDSTILDRTGGNGVDVVYMCTPRLTALYALRKALKYVRDHGCVDLVGGFSDGDTVPELPNVDLNSVRRANICGLPLDGIVNQYRTIEGKEISLIGHRGTSPFHLKIAMELLCQQPFHFIKIISHIISLQAAPDVLHHLIHYKYKPLLDKVCVKIIIDFTLDGYQIEVFEPEQAFLLSNREAR